MTQSLSVPPDVMAALQQIFERLYPGVEDIGLVLIAAKTNCIPGVCANIPPAEVDHLLQWLLDNRETATTEIHTMDPEGRIESGTIN